MVQLLFDCHLVLIKLLHKKSDWQKVGGESPTIPTIMVMSKKLRLNVCSYSRIKKWISGDAQKIFRFYCSPVERDPVNENPKEALKHQNSNSKWCDIAGPLLIPDNNYANI
jgi:hypothetical protein